MRWIKELIWPYIKCERVGHENRVVKRRIRKNSTGYYVCEDFKCSFLRCLRCGDLQKLEDEEYYKGFTSVSMPDYMWEEMEEKGFLIVD